MEAIKKNFKKMYQSDSFPFILLFIFIAILSIFVTKNGDTIFFSQVLEKESLGSWLVTRYETWSSRLVIEAVMVVVLQVGMILFHLINIALYVLLAWSISKLFVNHNKKILNYVICLCFTMFPIAIFNTAGWVATFTNYLWPCALGVFSLLYIKKIVKGEHIKKIEYPLYFIALVYACNQEQMAAILLACFLIFFVYSIKKKKLNVATVLYVIVTIASILFILTCPGNKVRNVGEIAYWYPNYATFDLLDKLQLAITSAMRYLILNGNILFIVFSLFLLIQVMKNQKDNFYRWIAAIPLVGSLIFNVLLPVVTVFVPSIQDLVAIYLRNELIINGMNFTSIIQYLMLFVYLIILCSILISLYLAFKNTYKSILAIFIYVLSFGSRFIMGFSPTVFASVDRTHTFLYVGLIMLILLCIKELIDKKHLSKMTIYNVLGGAATIQIISTVMYMILNRA